MGRRARTEGGHTGVCRSRWPQLGTFLRNEGISWTGRGPSRWSLSSSPSGQGRNVSSVSMESKHAAGSPATKMFSLPVLEKMQGGVGGVGGAAARSLGPSPTPLHSESLEMHR